MKHPILQVILWVIVVATALGSFACSSTKAEDVQNEVRWEYNSFLTTKKVDLTDIYATVRQVLINENIPGFTTQLKDKYSVETEWTAIRRVRDLHGSAIPHFLPPPPDSRLPTYIKYYIDISKKGYRISAVSNSRGIQWASLDQSYPDVTPKSEYWDAVIRLTQQINAALKKRIDKGRYGKFFLGPGSDRPFYSGSSNPAQTPTWAYPERPRNFRNYSSDSGWTPLTGEYAGAGKN